MIEKWGDMLGYVERMGLEREKKFFFIFLWV